MPEKDTQSQKPSPHVEREKQLDDTRKASLAKRKERGTKQQDAAKKSQAEAADEMKKPKAERS